MNHEFYAQFPHDILLHGYMDHGFGQRQLNENENFKNNCIHQPFCINYG